MRDTGHEFNKRTKADRPQTTEAATRVVNARRTDMTGGRWKKAEGEGLYGGSTGVSIYGDAPKRLLNCDVKIDFFF